MSATARPEPARWAVPAALAALGAGLDGFATFRPADVPLWLPFDFSWFAWAGTALPLWWYFRGVAQLPPARRP
ncbi:MAG: hypothetical protein ACP5NP_17050, partial [Acetobacteraceae bacterium]